MTNIIIHKRYIKDYSYPDYSDPDFLSKIYKKREFYYNKIQERDIIKSYDDIKSYRDSNCKLDEKPLMPQQLILPIFLNPSTIYKGVILMHGVGTGKTLTAIRIAEQFKEQVKKYNTKIYVLVPGPNTKRNFEKELLESLDNVYLNKDNLKGMTKDEIQKEKRIALFNALQYYKIMSYKTFHKKVLGEKIIEKKLVGDSKIAGIYKKSDTGEYERTIVYDKITSLNNTLIIIDEAHNITGNEYGDALLQIIKNSENLRIVLMTATPMINYADEIINLINFIRPLNKQLERDKVFTSEKNYLMKLKSDGLEYLKSNARGYISFYRGSVPYTFAKRNDKGTIPKELLFTSIVKCYMIGLQNETYFNLIKSNDIENLSDEVIEQEAASTSFTSGTLLLGNFVFPILNDNNTDLIGIYTSNGLIKLLSQLNSNPSKLCNIINDKIYNKKFSEQEIDNIIIPRKHNISGLILKKENIKPFSIKFYTLLENLDELVEGKKGTWTAFIYSNFVNVSGIDLFAETLIQNGYLEYKNDFNNYDIKDNTKDYKTGLTYSEFKQQQLVNFYPATFLLMIGGLSESNDEVSEIKNKYIQEVFNSIDNVDGKYIKFILGSKVMNEGVTLKNVKEVHIMEPHYNISKIEQVIGRAVRVCVHMDVINDNYKFPEVDIYRYVISSDKQTVSTDEILYKKAELKYLLIKDIEHALKEVSLDCPLLLNNNMFPEELHEYNNCIPLTVENKEKYKNKNVKFCPAICDFKPCNLQCDAPELNSSILIDNHTDNIIYKIYSNLNKQNIDYSTFQNFAFSEINIIKNKIKDIFRLKHIYLYDEIFYNIKLSYSKFQSELLEPIFLDLALNQLMPKTDNDFNNFKDVIYDIYNKKGYIIQRGEYYIFQPFNEHENITLFYRTNYTIENNNPIYLHNFINNKYSDKINNILEKTEHTKVKTSYDFDSTLEYYNNREENFIVGIIDKNNNKNIIDEDDIFKIRPKLSKNLQKKRGTGITTFKGTVCTSYKNKRELINLIKKIDSSFTKTSETNKLVLCKHIQTKLLELEKYSTTKQQNKKTYMIIPNNHLLYIFPYNLEDRIKYVLNKINNIINFNINHTVKKVNNTYHITLDTKNININSIKHILDYYKFTSDDNNNYISIFD